MRFLENFLEITEQLLWRFLFSYSGCNQAELSRTFGLGRHALSMIDQGEPQLRDYMMLVSFKFVKDEALTSIDLQRVAVIWTVIFWGPTVHFFVIGWWMSIGFGLQVDDDADVAKRGDDDKINADPNGKRASLHFCFPHEGTRHKKRDRVSHIGHVHHFFSFDAWIQTFSHIDVSSAQQKEKQSRSDRRCDIARWPIAQRLIDKLVSSAERKRWNYLIFLMTQALIQRQKNVKELKKIKWEYYNSTLPDI